MNLPRVQEVLLIRAQYLYLPIFFKNRFRFLEQHSLAKSFNYLLDQILKIDDTGF